MTDLVTSPSMSPGGAQPSEQHGSASAPVVRHFGALAGIAAAASVAAGLLHYAAVPEHRSEWQVAGVAFTLVGALQILWAAWLWIDERVRVLVVGAVANLAAIAVWLISRTVGMPVGPRAGEADSVGWLDAACVAAEAMVVVIVLTAIVSRIRRTRGETSSTA